MKKRAREIERGKNGNSRCIADHFSTEPFDASRFRRRLSCNHVESTVDLGDTWTACFLTRARGLRPDRSEESYAAPRWREKKQATVYPRYASYTPTEGPGQRAEDISRCRPTYHSFAAWRAADTARQQHSQIKERQSPRRRGVGMALSRFIKLR